MFGEYKQLLKNSNFISLWGSQILSQVTINILNFILLIRLFEATNSSIATSLLWIAYTVPAVLVGPIASATSDLVDRRKLLMITNLLESGVVLVYSFFHRSSVFLIYGVAVGYSFFNQFYFPAELSALPSVVSQRQLPNANSLFFITQQLALIVGFGLASPARKILGFNKLIFVCSLFLFLASISASLLPTLSPGRKKTKGGFEKTFFQFFQRIIEGYRFIQKERTVLIPLLLLIGMQVAFAMVVVNIPAIMRDIFRLPLEKSGFFLITPAAIGAGIAAVSVPKLLSRGVRKMSLIKKSLALLVISFFSLLFLTSKFLTIKREIVGIFAIALLGFSFIGILIPSQTFLQEKTPGGFRGRVFGNYWFLVTISTIFPVLISGTITELLGVRFLLLLMGALLFLILVIINTWGEDLLKKPAENFV